MKKLLLAGVMLLPIFSAAQQDIFNGAKTEFVVLGRNLVSGSSGPGGLNNNFLFTAAHPQEVICISLTNTSLGTGVSMTIKVSATADPSAKTFNGNTQRWSTLLNAPNTGTGGQAPGVAFIQQQTTFYSYIQVAGASQVNIQITGSGAGAPFDLIISQTASTTSAENTGAIIANNTNATPVSTAGPVLTPTQLSIAGGLGSPSTACVNAVGATSFGIVMTGTDTDAISLGATGSDGVTRSLPLAYSTTSASIVGGIPINTLVAVPLTGAEQQLCITQAGGGTGAGSVFMLPNSGVSGPLLQRSTANSLQQTFGQGSLTVEKGPRHCQNNFPAAGSQAALLITGGGTGVVHVLDSVSFSAVSTGAVTAANTNFDILDNGNIRISQPMSTPAAAAAGVQEIPFNTMQGLALPMTANTTFTVRFSAGVANVQEAVSACWYDTI